MRQFSPTADTIARRFALAVLLSIIVHLGLLALFAGLTGVWALEPLEKSGLLQQGGEIVRIIEAAPPPLRATLAAAAATKTLAVTWYDAASAPASSFADRFNRNDETLWLRLERQELRTAIQKEISRTTLIFKSDSPLAALPDLVYDRPRYPDAYFLAVRLDDESWVVLTALGRSWGIGLLPRIIVGSVLLIASITAVSLIAARRLSRPIERLAEAARLFGSNPLSPAMAEAGPRELRQMIQTFNAMQAQIQKFIAYRATMLAAISHDLRTPLTRMRLRGEYIEDPEQQARLFRDVDEMQSMIDGALAFFRDDSAAEEIVTFDLPGMLLTIANDYADQGIEIAYRGPLRASCRGRPFALKRAVANLVDNAIQYATPPEIELAADQAGLTIAIRDSGPGIPPVSLDRVFQPYYRLDKSRNRATGGVGLGLTSAQALVRSQGGDISLVNRPEGGLEARITLPTAPQPAFARGNGVV